MKDLRPVPDEASDHESASKLLWLHPSLGTQGLDVEEHSTGVGSSPV